MSGITNKPLGDRHVSATVRKALTDLTRPLTLSKGDGEFGIGKEYQKAEMRTYLETLLGPYPWYTK